MANHLDVSIFNHILSSSETERRQNMKSQDYTIRLEEKKDYRAVENLVRESFWNVYRPGCSEHYVIHCLRNDPAFVPELDFVMFLKGEQSVGKQDEERQNEGKQNDELQNNGKQNDKQQKDSKERSDSEKDGALIGQNIFMKTIIESDDGRKIDVLTMGPIGIAPELKRKGYGKALLDYSLEKAVGLGFGAVLFEGNIGFYGKSGFDYASKFGIRYHDLPEDADSSFFLCKELIPGYLDGVTGVYQTPQGYYVKDEDVEEFDKEFPPKEKLKLPGQIF